MKRILKVIFQTRRKEWAIPIPPSREGHVNMASFSLKSKSSHWKEKLIAKGGFQCG